MKEILRTEVGITRNVDVPSLMTRISLWKNKMFKGPDEIPASTFEYDAIARDVYPHYEDGASARCTRWTSTTWWCAP